MATALRLIDRITKASSLTPVKKEVELDSGEIIVLYVTPLTAAERDRAKREAKSDDAVAFALQLLVRKAQDENGQPLFAPGDVAALKNQVRDSDLQKLLLAVLGNDEEAIDMKSSED